jgi:hypothetical protein
MVIGPPIGGVMSLRQVSMAAALIVLGATLSSCARVACEWEWRTTMAQRLVPAREADRLTRQEIRRGQAAFKQDFLDVCLGR